MVDNLLHSIDEDAIDILINNAGIYGERSIFGNVSSNDWQKVFHVNVIAPMMLTQTLVHKIAASRERKIIFMTSKMGSIEDNQRGGSYVYRSSKAALNAVGKSLSIDLLHQHIKVALLHPGWVKTDMGGKDAPLDVVTSVSGLINVIDRLKENQSGHFLNYAGTVIPW
ncbi:C-factor [invertebrate metagenome]|uniref:C-factor n=1 Tax=invertebrate metagenome TaxID=1711999 RepID=A0A2H9T4A2_9ZZZZ